MMPSQIHKTADVPYQVYFLTQDEIDNQQTKDD
jgi:hypothetical protein